VGPWDPARTTLRRALARRCEVRTGPCFKFDGSTSRHWPPDDLPPHWWRLVPLEGYLSPPPCPDTPGVTAIATPSPERVESWARKRAWKGDSSAASGRYQTW